MYCDRDGRIHLVPRPRNLKPSLWRAITVSECDCQRGITPEIVSVCFPQKRGKSRCTTIHGNCQCLVDSDPALIVLSNQTPCMATISTAADLPPPTPASAVQFSSILPPPSDWKQVDLTPTRSTTGRAGEWACDSVHHSDAFGLTTCFFSSHTASRTMPVSSHLQKSSKQDG